MNTDTGQIYRGDDEIRAARGRGEPLVELRGDAYAVTQAHYDRADRLQETRRVLAAGKRIKRTVKR